MGKYDDIIDMKRPISKKHKPMSMYERAAQFAPFAALKGHDEAIADTIKVAMETDPTYTLIDDPTYTSEAESDFFEDLRDRKIREQSAT